MNFVKASLKYRQVTLTILFIVFVTGVYSLISMPRREDPKITMPAALVITYYPGATSEQVEERVTKKLEQYLFQFEEVNKSKTHSTSMNGISVISVWLNDNVKKPDIFWNKLRHQLLIAKNIDLPQGVRGPIVNSDFGDTEAMLIGIASDKASYAELNNCAIKLEDNLRTIKAASKIKRIGMQQEQIAVYFDSEKMSQIGISLQQVVRILQSQNTIDPAGEINTENNNVPLYTSGFYQTETEIRNQIIGTSKTGSVLHLGDIANIKREYTEPTSHISVNGQKAIIISVQMNDGNNIVWFGKDVNKITAEIGKQLPGYINIITIVNQPELVNSNVSHFLLEFMLAIISVIIVVMLLLPFRIAAVAATAIPITVSVTFALLHIIGVELHQVSLASLIVVLGMVVDDAIVVSDNYVDLIDKGTDHWTAAWRSASDLVIPILTATITIIASFMPMIILTGAIGEFIRDLPITVTVALSSSFIVAMVLTPLLCLIFIKKGLKKHDEKNLTGKRNTSFLDWMQYSYNHAIDWCANHPKITVGGSLSTVLLAGILFITGVRQKFMPYAERNQFVVELWMPSGTKLDKTQQIIARFENIIKDDKRVVSYATYTGTSAPRVYYNFSPEFPVSNYAQILVNTTNEKTTELFAHELSKIADKLAPEGMAQVKLMQQGQPLNAPVEIRIFGDDINKIREIGNEVKTILKNSKGSYQVHDNFREDLYGLNIKLKEGADRLGFTTESVSQLVYTGFKGYPISTIYEGNEAADIVLRLDKKDRQRSQDLENIYLESPVTGSSVPLRQIAEIKPEWQIGRIMHRNGMRCMTVGSETTHGLLPAELLKTIKPKINKMQLPVGYHIEYGGESANKQEVFSYMFVALVISLLLIFLILLFQFRNLKETSIIMITIPLSLFGAIFGLFITGNNFGFTAFMGLISLSGIVVRNAIILIDHTNELLNQGMDIRKAAINAGKRRLRPVFLTAMAAAIGVLPMIMSGSSLWSPLASVIAFGITWSMLMALLTVPVLYMIMIKPAEKTNMSENKIKNPHVKNTDLLVSIFIILIFVLPAGLNAQQTSEKLGVDQLTDLAVQNNRLLSIKQMQVNEKQQKVNEDKVKYFPVVSIGGSYQYNSNLAELRIPQGSFGQLPLGSVTILLPFDDEIINLGSHDLYNAGANFYQPVSQIPKIKAGVQVSKTELQIAQTEQVKATMQIKQAVEKLYYGLWIIQKQKEEVNYKIALAKKKLYDIESALIAGKTTESSLAGLKASVADEQQNLLKLEVQYDYYFADLLHITGLPAESTFELDSIPAENILMDSLLIDTLLREAKSDNNDLKLASLIKTKADYAIKAAKLSYLPDVGIMGGYAYQKGNKIYPANNMFIGASFKWNIQDLFSNTFIQGQRFYLKQQAEENFTNTQEQISTDITKACRRLIQARELINVTEKVVVFRREDLKIQVDKKYSGLNIEADLLAAKATLAKAESELFAARLNYRLALTDLKILTGKY
jgi:multidrug efflux pump subunit AcrB/outer membrane protein TolC